MTDSASERSLQSVLDDIAAAPPGFGGGAVAAGCLALAAELVAVAARASVEGWEEAGGAAAQAALLRARAGRLAEENLIAYAAARAALRPPEEGDAGGGELGPALAAAADVPLRIAAAGADTARLAELVARHGDDDRRPDAVAAACMAEAVTAVATTLVEANLAVMAGDPRADEVRKAAGEAAEARAGAQRAAADA